MNLGTGTTFNVKELVPEVDYTTLTEKNFIAEPISQPMVYVGPRGTGADDFCGGGNYSFTKSYAATTGILTVPVNAYLAVNPIKNAV